MSAIHADSSSDDEKEIMERNWKKNISTIKKVGIINICTFCRNIFISIYTRQHLEME